MTVGSPATESAGTDWLHKASDASRWYKRLRSLLDRRQAARILKILIGTNGGLNDDLTYYRNTGLTQILTFANRYCPYYNVLFADLRIDPRTHRNFTKLPCLDKAAVIQRRSELMPDCLRYLAHVTKKTGGSTGEPLEFPMSDRNRFMDYAHYEFSYHLMGWLPGDTIATFGGRIVSEELRERNVFWLDSNPVSDLPDGRRHYSALYLNKTTIPYYIEQILATKPTILRGHPSFINEIAEYILENSIEVPFKVKGIQFTAEKCYDWQAEIIKNAFSTILYSQYGHSEGAVFGFTRGDSGEYYCSPFFGLTEVLEPDGEHVKIGESGEVVVTGFHNFALPFIRYRTGDMAVYGGERNGVVVLTEIQGREQDYILSSDGRRNAITTLHHLKAFSNMSAWQIVQDVPGRIRVMVVKKKEFSNDDSNEMKAEFSRYFGAEAEILFVESVPRTSVGKIKLLVQNIPSGYMMQS